jgi:HAE1 family hydrophobic/amphiphilic exporter-1
MLFLLLTVAGLIAYAELPVTNMPNVVVPVVTVQLDQPGALPSEIETQVTRKVEGALAAMQGVKHITSTVSEGVSVTTVEFSLDTDIDRAVNDARNAVSSVRGRLPSTVQEPIVQRRQEAGEAILIYSVEAPEMRAEELSAFIDDTLSRELLAIGGVARVARNGGVEQEVTISVDPARLTALGITAADISRQLAATNADVPGGRLKLDGTEYALRTIGRAATLEQLRDMRVALANGREVKLGDLGAVERGGDETRTITRIDGRPAITFSIFRSQAASEVTVAHKVKARLDEIAKQRGGLEFRQVFSLVTLTEIGFKSTLYTLLEGVLLTLVVVYAFLRDRRATVITALSIPLSIIPTFLCMQWLGFTLNFVSVIAISLVTGALVDDAIVEIENIHRHMRAGKRPFEAAMHAAEEIGVAVIATTLVICAVFVPVSFMGGVPGLYFRQFGLTVAIAAFFSLVVARLLTPMLAARLLRPLPAAPERDGAWMQRYQRMVAWTLRHRVKTLGIAAGTVVLSFALVPLLPSGFMPYQDLSLSSMTIELPQGSTLEETDARAQQIAAMLKARPEVSNVLTTTGKASGGVNRARILATLVPPKERSLSEREFGNEMLPKLAALPDVRVTFDNMAGDKDISIALVSEDTESLTRSAEAIEREMRGLAGLSSVGTSARQRQPEITLTVDSVKAARLGITAQQIGDAVNVSTVGDDDARLAQFNDHSRQIPIRVRLPAAGHDLGVLENLKLTTPAGTSVPLSSVATIRFGMGPTTIERYDRQRRINLEANLNGIALGTALEQINALPSMRALPKTVHVMNTADAEFMAELMISFLKALGGGLLLVYAIQVLLYKDWLQPLTRMAALPLAIGGSFALLFVTHSEFGLPAMIGIIMLMGIADKNSILLVDYILEKMREGMPRNEAILLACRVRARPIVMTSFAMAAGMLPTAMSLGLDPAFRAPMALAVIGGLISSTALSLVFMPVLFSYVRDFEEWIARRRAPAPRMAAVSAD